MFETIPPSCHGHSLLVTYLSSLREGADVPGLIDGCSPEISKGPCLAGSNESMFSG